jgi:hypothetical protein
LRPPPLRSSGAHALDLALYDDPLPDCLYTVIGGAKITIIYDDKETKEQREHSRLH